MLKSVLIRVLVVVIALPGLAAPGAAAAGVVVEVFTRPVTAAEIGEAAKETDKLRATAWFVERQLYASLAQRFDIPADEKSIDGYLRATYPEAFSSASLEEEREQFRLLLPALQRVVREGESPDVVYEEMLRGEMDAEHWRQLAEQLGDERHLTELERLASRDDAGVVAERVAALRPGYLPVAVRNAICATDPVAARIGRHVAAAGLDADDPAAPGMIHYQCQVEARAWLIDVVERNVVLKDTAYEGYQGHLSFWAPIPFSEAHEPRAAGDGED